MGTPFGREAGTPLTEAFLKPVIQEVEEGATTQQSYKALLAARARPVEVVSNATVYRIFAVPEKGRTVLRDAEQGKLVMGPPELFKAVGEDLKRMGAALVPWKTYRVGGLTVAVDYTKLM